MHSFFRFSRSRGPALALTLTTTLLGASAPGPSTSPATTQLGAVTVTGTREKALLRETPVSIAAIDADTVRQTAPLHPAQLLGQVPGVAIAVTNGEGHTTAIRQPFTTSPVYLFLEDGIPIRATGFFNHNALYEVNIPMAGGVEIVRGPGTALHGSDAIAGIVNVLSRAPTPMRHATLLAEAGAFGTWRLLGGGGGAAGERGAFRLDVNRTHTDGWRERTAYDRVSGNLRFDRPLGRDGMLKTIVGFSDIDQQTGANSPLTGDDYRHRPTRNLRPIGFRTVRAVRASAEYERQFGPGMFSVIPYFRDNAMELNGTFNLSSDPRIEYTRNVSYGLLTKARVNLPAMRTRLIGGLDLDRSPGSHREDNILVTRIGSGADAAYESYAPGTRIYDYDVTFTSTSPYVHAEFSPTSRVRVTTGLRYDALDYRMRNRLPTGAVEALVLGARRYYAQWPENRTRFSHLSPKIGATFALHRQAHLYASYNCGFRAPSESQLYRAGNESSVIRAGARAERALALQPIEARQVEVGVRGEMFGWTGHVVAYRLEKTNDLVAQRDLATNVSTSVNAGQTEHAGIEAGFRGPLGRRLRLDAAVSHARHRYVRWLTASEDFGGREMEAAPRVLLNTRLTWRPSAPSMLQLEWTRVGRYWLEAGNSPRFGQYPGHDLVNVRVGYDVSRRVGLFARVMNAADKRYAESASITSNTPTFSPGLPRAWYAGAEVRW